MKLLVPTLMGILSFSAVAETPRYFAWRVTADGFGPLRLGMTTADLSNALGRNFSTDDRSYSEGDCSSYSVGTGSEFGDFRILSTEGVVKRIDVYAHGISTDRAIEVGSKLNEVRLRHPGLQEFTGHYLEDEATIPLSPSVALHFTFQEDAVAHFRVGLLPEVHYIEGCL